MESPRRFIRRWVDRLILERKRIISDVNVEIISSMRADLLRERAARQQAEERVQNGYPAAMVKNDNGDLLVWTCQPLVSQCEEEASRSFPAWERMKQLGAKVVRVRIVED